MEVLNLLMRAVTKQLTGIFLFCVMTIVLALETSAVKYCLCDSSFVVSDCGCEAETESLEASCSSCCSGVAESIAEPICKTHGGKEDCLLSFTMELGEYHQGSNFEFSPRDAIATFTPADFLIRDDFAPELGVHMYGGLESPPLLFSEPIFVRNSVFLL